MAFLYDAARLAGDTLGHFLVFLIAGVLWQPLLTLIHELGHAVTALEQTDGQVEVVMNDGGTTVDFGRCRLRLGLGPIDGRCLYEPETLRHPRGDLWIGAAGPLTSLAVTLSLTMVAVAARGDSPALARVLMTGALLAGFQTAMTGLPLRYDTRGGSRDSDGRAIWRILTGGMRAARTDPEPRRAIRPVYTVLWLCVAALAFAVSLELGLITLGLLLWGVLVQLR